MSQKSQLAANCFRDNLSRYGNKITEPEKYNLYAGLAALADAIGGLEAELSATRRELSQAQQQINQIKTRVP